MRSAVKGKSEKEIKEIIDHDALRQAALNRKMQKREGEKVAEKLAREEVKKEAEKGRSRKRRLDANEAVREAESSRLKKRRVDEGKEGKKAERARLKELRSLQSDTQKEAAKVLRQKKIANDAKYLTAAEISEKREDSMGRLQTMSKEDLEALHNATATEFSIEMNQLACAVCDRFHSHKITNEIPIMKSNKIIVSIQKRCVQIEELHEDLVLQYSIPNPLLEGLLLSPRGHFFSPDKSLDEFLHVCQECHKSLKRKTKNVGDVKPPKFAICNGFAVGTLPDEIWNYATHVHYRLVSQTTLNAMRLVISAGPHATLKGHCILYDNGLTSPAEKLPRLFNCMGKENVGDFHVVYASNLADRDRLLSLNSQLASYPMLVKLLDIYRDWNPDQYGNIVIGKDNLNVYRTGIPDEMVLVADYDAYVKQGKFSQGPATTHVQLSLLYSFFFQYLQLKRFASQVQVSEKTPSPSPDNLDLEAMDVRILFLNSLNTSLTSMSILSARSVTPVLVLILFLPDRWTTHGPISKRVVAFPNSVCMKFLRLIISEFSRLFICYF